MQPVEAVFDLGNYRHTQLARQGEWALYEQRHRDNAAVVRFEVVRLRVRPAHTWPNGAITPEHEAYPGASSWGKDGFTTHTYAQAEALLASLVQPSDEKEACDVPSPRDAV